MAFMLPSETILTFQNTGREHSKTLDFLCRLEDDLQVPIIRLEWRPPPQRGDAPKLATFAELTHRELSRKGEPFRELLETIAAFRRVEGKGPIAPWARQRLCTSYLKIRVMHRYATQTLGLQEYTKFVGLRADEEDRVRQLRETARRNVDVRVPLFDAGINKADVMLFWSKKPYDLNLPEHLGNCVECFLKDERDLATALLDSEGSPEFAIGIEHDFAPMRRGGRPSYSQVFNEAPSRMVIREAINAGKEPLQTPTLSEHRFKLIVRQEKQPKTEGWSCGCAGAELLAAEDDD